MTIQPDQKNGNLCTKRSGVDDEGSMSTRTRLQESGWEKWRRWNNNSTMFGVTEFTGQVFCALSERERELWMQYENPTLASREMRSHESM